MEKKFKIINPAFPQKPIFATIKEIHKDILSTSEQKNCYVDNSKYCLYIATNNFNEDIYEDDILVTTDGDISRVFIQDGAILIGEIEKSSNNFLVLEPFLNYRVIGNYNDKSSFSKNEQFLKWCKLMERDYGYDKMK